MFYKVWLHGPIPSGNGVNGNQLYYDVIIMRHLCVTDLWNMDVYKYSRRYSYSARHIAIIKKIIKVL